MRLPVKCPDCGGIFLSRSYDLSGNISCWGNTETCIYCGRHRALLSEGVFRISKDVIEILQSPAVTKQNFQQLINLAQRVRDKSLTLEEATEQAEQIKSGWGKYITRWTKGDVLAACALLVAGYTWYDAKEGATQQSAQMERLISAVEKKHSPQKKVEPQSQRKNTKPNAASGTPTENRHARRRAEALKRKSK